MLVLAAVMALLSDGPGGRASVGDALRACLGVERYTAEARLEQLRKELSPAQWREACRQAREADARRRSVVRAVLSSGASPVGGYRAAVREVELAREAKDPVVAELFRRSARDQAERSSLSFMDGGKTYAAGLTPPALTLLDAIVSAEAVAVDAENRAWLTRVVATRGWFTISRDGERADSSAWFLVQHGDMDPDFQRSMIAVLEPLAAAGETSKRRLAYLYDRWAGNADKPQRYGIKGRCTGPGVWEAREIEDPLEVEARREAAGLPGSFAKHREEMSRSCR